MEGALARAQTTLSQKEQVSARSISTAEKASTTMGRTPVCHAKSTARAAMRSLASAIFATIKAWN
jgi:phage terminase small subunit